jgi:hypothetical protein
MFIYMAALLAGMYHFSTIENPDALFTYGAMNSSIAEFKKNGGLSRDVSNPNLYVNYLIFH